MELTVLMENTGNSPFHPEHGLSLYLRHPGGRVLLDAGQSGAFLDNAALLGVPAGEPDFAALSHGHYDHGDGFLPLFRQNPALRVLARPDALKGHTGPGGRYIGLCPALRGEYTGRFLLSDKLRAIGPGLYLIPDAVSHEQSLAAEREDGSLVVMNSCCHAGADNIVREILRRFPGRRVSALVGGLHLMGPDGPDTLGQPPEAVETLARRLTEELGVERVYTGHCTGAPAFALLDRAAPGRFFPLYTGQTLQF
ncbi:MAG: MBL fold metallo-hydrolase [Oscillospiraceae bacterium]|nr:MBL fold metallo-hydrolase [Oscillospiraceae bacterium]